MKNTAILFLAFFLMLSFNNVLSQNSVRLQLPNLCTEAVTVSIMNLSFVTFDIYPNPCNGILSLILSENCKDHEVYISVINMHGITLMTQRIKPTQETFSIHLGQLPDGFYIIQVKDRNGSSYKKLMLQK